MFIELTQVIQNTYMVSLSIFIIYLSITANIRLRQFLEKTKIYIYFKCVSVCSSIMKDTLLMIFNF